ncbi:type II secretion system F family protein [Streptomyces sp. BK205]|uniref:type II secretion system F family protein n=1 Tax=Streptomyces sp. BK205 TaxID=2512164 RepID=UPI00104E8E43|nr:type II secretion system F family protein [Streptomyces sp. BK205]TCR23708.1 type II secretion system (T2SS) protein F [Streptomyces sp. BK205]
MSGMGEMPVDEMSVGAAAGGLGLAVWLWGRRRSGLRRAQALFAGGGVVGVGPPVWGPVAGELRRVRERLGIEWSSAVVGLVLAVLGASVLPLIAGAAGVPLLRRVRLAREARRVRERRADAVIALCAAVAGEVRAGRQPGEALVLAVRDLEGAGGEGARAGAAWGGVTGSGGLGAGGAGPGRVPGAGGLGAGVAGPGRPPGAGGLGAGGAGPGRVPGAGGFGLGVGRVGPGVPGRGGLGEAQAVVLAAARFGGDVPGALAAAARRPGAEGLLGLAACWRVAVDQGAGLAAGLDRLEGALRAERDQRADLRAQLAGARSTAWMLAALPVLGLGLGAALGADPLRVLLHSGAGLGCLVVGGVLEGVGMWWAMRIVRGAEAT